ncbi:MAG: prepilin peptidase, partial [Planctomycetes bacterium]|nr:prepilin peptidase [Planctomycetota bacterium]
MDSLWESFREHCGLYSSTLLLAGAMAGSFSSAAIHRLPDPDLGMTRPRRSFCPRCSKQLAWVDNIPILSWVVRGGRCRHCEAPIPLGYLLNEVGLAGLFLVLGHSGWAQEEGPVALGFLLTAMVALWIATIVDWKHFILPDEITLGGIPAGILASILVPNFQLWVPERLPWGVEFLTLSAETPLWQLSLASSILGIMGAGALLFGIRGLFSYLLRQEAMGLGDVKYLAAVGAWLGLEGAAWVLLVGVVLGAVFGLANVLRMIFVVFARHRRRGRHAGVRGAA